MKHPNHHVRLDTLARDMDLLNAGVALASDHRRRPLSRCFIHPTLGEGNQSQIESTKSIGVGCHAV